MGNYLKNEILLEHNYSIGMNFIESRELDRIEEQKVKNFLIDGCYCSKGPNNTNCFKNPKIFKHIIDHRINITEMENKIKDSIILGFIAAGISREFNRNYCEFRFNGYVICRKTFLFVNNISRTRYNNLFRHYLKNNIREREKNWAKINKSYYSFEMKENCVNFIENFANINGYPIPGNMPYNSLNKTRISLPCFYTKIKVYEEYRKFSIDNNQNFVKKSSFFRFWNRYKPDIRVMTPRTDVCLICKNSLTAIMKVSVDQDDNELINAYVKHRELAKNQRNYFNEQKNESKKELNDFLRENQNLVEYKGKAQYSFDFAQNLKFPNFSTQPGIMYFKSLRNCHLFGITCGNNNTQLNYLIDEADVNKKKSRFSHFNTSRLF
jgi:hypothetical protein